MPSRLLLFVLLTGCLLGAGFAACGDDDDDGDATNPPASAVGGDDAIVAISDNKFEPNNVTVTPNHEVTWEWSGGNPHSVVGTFDGESVRSPQLTGGGTFTFSFSKAGTFEYQCGVHGASMSGRVIVE